MSVDLSLLTFRCCLDIRNHLTFAKLLKSASSHALSSFSHTTLNLSSHTYDQNAIQRVDDDRDQFVPRFIHQQRGDRRNCVLHRNQVPDLHHIPATERVADRPARFLLHIGPSRPNQLHQDRDQIMVNHHLLLTPPFLPHLHLIRRSRRDVRQAPRRFLHDQRVGARQQLPEIRHHVQIQTPLRLVVVARQHVAHRAQRGRHHLAVRPAQQLHDARQRAHLQNVLRVSLPAGSYRRVLLVVVGDEREAPAGVGHHVLLAVLQHLQHVRQADLHALEVRRLLVARAAQIRQQPHAVLLEEGRAVFLRAEKQTTNPTLLSCFRISSTPPALMMSSRLCALSPAMLPRAQLACSRTPTSGDSMRRSRMGRAPH